MIEEGVTKRNSRADMTSVYGVIRKTPTTLNKDGQLNLVNKNIHYIGDKLPVKISLSITKLYLSGNFLTNLCHLDQFQNLRTVSLMNNNLRYLETLQPLSKLRNLEVLSLGGNVVSKMPYYHEYTVVMCKSLRRLDDIKITNADRARAVERFHKISSFYNKLRENELRNSVLVHVSKMMSCHLEMRREVFGSFSHILGGHIGVLPMEKDQYGAGRILQQALEGGVFCWLQRMDSQHLSRLVQNTLLKLLLAQQQRKNASYAPTQPPIIPKRGGGMLAIAGVTVSPAARTGGEDHSEIWEGVVGSYLREQYEFYLDLSRYCEHLQSTYRRLYNGNCEDSVDTQLSAVAKDQDLIGHCVETLRVLSTHTAVSSEPSRKCFCGGDPGSCNPSPHCHYAGEEAEGGSREAGFPPRARTPLVSVLNVQQQPLSVTDTASIMARNKLHFAESRVGDTSVGRENAGCGHISGRLIPAAYECNNRQQHFESSQLAAELVSDGVQDRYVQLLSEHIHKRGDASVERKATGFSIGTSAIQMQQGGANVSMLPPQQPDPDTAPALDPPQYKAIVELTHHASSGALQENAASHSVPPVADLQSLSEQDALAFIARAIESRVLSRGDNEIKDDSVTITEELQKLSREMESRFLSEAQQIEEWLRAGEERALLEESRIGYDAYRKQHCSEYEPRSDNLASAASSQNIHTLHMSIKALAARYTLCTIEEVRLYKTNAALFITANMLHKQSSSLIDRAVQKLTESGAEVESVLGDTRAGAVYLQVLQADLHLVEEIHEKIKVLRESQQSLRGEEELLSEELRTVKAATLAVTSRIQTAISQREEAEFKISGDPALCALARCDKVGSLAAEFWANSRSCRLLKRCMFQILRRNLRSQQKIKCFQQQQQRNRSITLKLLIFNAWKRCVRIAFRAAQLTNWKNRMNIGKALHAWLHSYAHSALRLPALQARHRRRCLERVFTAMHHCMHSRQKTKEVQTRQELYIALFYSVRIFRAWRGLVIVRRQKMAECLLAVRQHTLARMFACWTSAAEYVSTLRQDNAVTMRNRLEKKICLRAFSVWYRVFCYRSRLSIYRCKRRSFLGLLRRLAQQSLLRAQMRWVADGAVAMRLRKYTLRRACRKWSMFSKRQASSSLAERQLRLVYYCRLLDNVWSRWKTSAQRCIDFHRRFITVQSRSQLALLVSCWRQWLNAAVVGGQVVLSKGQRVRTAWLQMFHDTAAKIGSTVESDLNNRDDPDPLLIFQAAGAGKQSTISNKPLLMRHRNLMNFNAVELQLLYWDSDSDDNKSQQLEQEGLVEDDCDALSVGSNISKVLVGRYWRRWQGRHRCRANLQIRSKLVQRLATIAECRRRLGSWCAVFLCILSERAAFYSRSPDASATKSYSYRYSEIEKRGESSRARINELRPLFDGLTTSMAESSYTENQQKTVLYDLDSSLEALFLEKSHLEGSKRKAQDFISSIQCRRDQFIEKQSQQGQNSTGDLDVGFVSPQVSAIIGRLSVINSTNAELFGTLVGGLNNSSDERLLLMQDVEALYADAVAVQEKLIRQKQHLNNQKTAATTLLEIRLQQTTELDGLITTFRAERAAAEVTLADCRGRVHDTLQEVESQTRFHEKTLAELAMEEERLQEQLVVLTHEEQALMHTLSKKNCSAQIGGTRTGDALFNEELAHRETNATDLLLAVRAVASTGEHGTAAASFSALVPSMNLYQQQSTILSVSNRHAVSKSQTVQKVPSHTIIGKGNCYGHMTYQCPQAAANRGKEDAATSAVEGQIDALSARIRSRLSAF